MASAAGEAATAANGGTGTSAAELFGDGGNAGGSGAPQGGETGGGGANGSGAGQGAQAGSEGNSEGVGANGADHAWLEQLSGEVGDGEAVSVRDWVKSKNFKDMTALAKSAWHAEKALHDAGKVKVPGEGASEAELKAFHAAIGVPDDAKGYALAEIKDEAGNAVPMNTPLLDRLAGVALKAGVPKAGYEALINDFVKSQLEEVAGADAEQKSEAQAKLKEWGTAKAAKMAACDQALAALDLSKDEALKLRGALGAGRAMDMFAKLGEGLAEDSLLASGGPKRFGITGSEAQAQIDAMRADAAVRDKIMVPGSPERARYDRLLKIAGEEAERAAQKANLDA